MLHLADFDPVPKKHPIQKRFETGKEGLALLLLCDDTEDHPSKVQTSKNIQPYYEWHTLLIPGWAIKDIERKWDAIKKDYQIPDCYLHSRKHSKKYILRPESSIRRDIHNLILNFESIEHYITVTSENYVKLFKIRFSNEEKYKKIKENWNLDDPKEQALFAHLMTLDGHLPTFHYKPEAYIFCDQIFTTHKKIQKLKLESQSGWFTCGHGWLDHIYDRIAFRTPGTTDSIGNCLDLVDYCAWVHQRVKKEVCLRDYGAGGLNFTNEEWDSRVSSLPLEIQELCNFFKAMFDKKKTRVVFAEQNLVSDTYQAS